MQILYLVVQRFLNAQNMCLMKNHLRSHFIFPVRPGIQAVAGIIVPDIKCHYVQFSLRIGAGYKQQRNKRQH